MELEGTVENGAVVLDEPTSLPDGTRVKLRTEEEQVPTLAELFKDVIGQGVDLPEDYALNHHHYVHGGPKR